MPITKSAAKASRQSETRRARRRPFKTQLHTMMRKLSESVKSGKKDEALKLLPQVHKVIDTAAKKNIVHRKNADRKKSLMTRLVGSLK